MSNKKELNKLVDDVIADRPTTHGEMSRRVWFQNAGLVAASGAMMWACGRKSSDDDATAGPINYAADATNLNAALALEHEAIGIYNRAAGANIWTASPNDQLLLVAAAFLANHKAHRDALIAKITALNTTNNAGVTIAVAKADNVYLTDATLNTIAGISGTNGPVAAVLQYAAFKELAASQAYAGLVSKMTDPNIAGTMGLLSGDEASHFGVLRGAIFLCGALKDAAYNFSGTNAITAGTIINAESTDKMTTKNPLA